MLGWKHTGQARPPFAEEPGPGQESVWDYPRPPLLLPDERRVRVCLGERVIAETSRALRLLETASPPTFYLPPEDVDTQSLTPSSGGTSFCEWKGKASYFDLDTDAGRIANVAWSYVSPNDAYGKLAGHYAFYPGRLECYVGDERVRAQPGGFYGGWMTSEIVGPVKGEPGTGGW